MWDLFDGDRITPVWIVDFGFPLKKDARGNDLYFIAEGRLFLDAPNGVSNNYQMWGGLRYTFGR